MQPLLFHDRKELGVDIQRKENVAGFCGCADARDAVVFVVVNVGDCDCVFEELGVCHFFEGLGLGLGWREGRREGGMGDFEEARVYRKGASQGEKEMANDYIVLVKKICIFANSWR